METGTRKWSLPIRFTKVRVLLLSTLIIALILTFGLRGEVPPKTIEVIDGTKYIQPIYDEGQTQIVGYADNLQNWTISQTIGTSTLESVTLGNGLVINGTFPPNGGQQAVRITKEVEVNLTAYPAVDISFKLSGTSMGVNFQTVESSTSYSAGSLVLGANGNLQNIRTTLLSEGVQSNAKVLIEFYVNEGPGTSQVDFSLQVKSLQFLGYQTSQMNGNSGFHSAYLAFNSSMPLGNSSWPLNHINLDASVNASDGATYDLFLINGSHVYDEGTYKFSPTIYTYEYTLTPQHLLTQSEIDSFNGTLPETRGEATIAIVATSGYLINVSVQYARFIFLAEPQSYSSVFVQNNLDGYLYAYVISFLFIVPLLSVFYIYQKFRGGGFSQKHIILAVLLGTISRLALAPITSHPYDTLVYVASARAWFQYGIPNISLGPTLPLTFFLYRIPYSFYALLQFAGLHDLHFMGHTQGMLETVFIKAFPMIADYAVFYFLIQFDKTDSRIGSLFGAFYLLNPLSIYISAVWGQYEAATLAFIVMGFWVLVNRNTNIRTQLITSILLTLSAMLELFAIIPLIFIIIRSFFAKPFKASNPLVLAAPLLLFFVYQPEWHAAYLVFLSVIGAIPVLGFSTPSIYSLAGAFPWISNYHFLLISLFLIALGFIVYARFDIETTLSFTMGAFLSMLLFGNQLVQWWGLVLPLAFLIALRQRKYSLGIFMPIFGAFVTFVALSYAQGSGYMTLGNQQLELAPLIESVKNNIPIYSLSSGVAALLLVIYMIKGSSSGEHTMRNSSILLLSLFIVEFVVM
ncbi:MAG: hypothetical protein JRN67_10205, partial [Nitrososphaerota archaeon]|nr:hypothetical protein [Nitrososphaerota archaeon]